MNETADLVHPDAAFRSLSWSWSEPMHGEHFRRCSWCGSIHPDDLAAEPVWRADWADRKYGYPHKFYVDMPNRDPDALFAVSTFSGSGATAAPAGEGWVAVAGLTDEQRATVDRDRMLSDHTRYVQFGTRPNHFGKFYTTHLADPAISAEVKDLIERRSGLVFTFDGGRVSWRAYPYEPVPAVDEVS